MTSIYLPCPRCGEEVEIGMHYQPPEWDTNVPEMWEAADFTRSCDCHLTEGEDDALAAEAEKRANADPEFGVTLDHYDDGGW
jgi:hypothetical protein